MEVVLLSRRGGDVLNIIVTCDQLTYLTHLLGQIRSLSLQACFLFFILGNFFLIPNNHVVLSGMLIFTAVTNSKLSRTIITSNMSSALVYTNVSQKSYRKIYIFKLHTF